MEGSGTMKRGACVPESTDIEPLVRAYVTYLIKHPEDKQLEKRVVLLFALATPTPVLLSDRGPLDASVNALAVAQRTVMRLR